MKFLRWFLAIIGLLFLLILAFVTPIVWLAVILYLFGIYQVRQKRRGKVTFSKPGWIISAAIVWGFILLVIFSESTEEITKEKAEVQINREEIKEQENNEKIAAELKAQEDERKTGS